MRDQIRRVRPASQRHRGEIGRVGLDEYPVKRRYDQRIAKLIIGLERDRASKGKVRPAIQASPGEMIIAGEAVHHHPRGPALGIEHIRMSSWASRSWTTRVLSKVVRDCDVRCKRVPLHCLTGRIGCPEIIQSGLPHCSDARMLGQRLDQLQA